MIPYGRHEITEADRQAVLDALDSGWLTGGPTSRAFEADLGCLWCPRGGRLR